MEILLHSSFTKDFKKLAMEVKMQFVDRKRIFKETPSHPLLHNHQLHGEWSGHRSINVTGDFRAIFYTNDTICVFVRIGTHSELYG
jgi:addiction module RelE/StbE family toxin